MVATAATSSFFPVTSPSPDSRAKSTKLGTANLGGTKSKSGSGALQVKANAQAPLKINGTSVGLASHVESNKNKDAPARTFSNQLPDWSMLLAAITTVFLAAEKQWMMLDWKPKWNDMLIDPSGMETTVQVGRVLRRNFSIRSYEVGADLTASIETVMNHLQETALNHVKSIGLLGGGFGSTPEMKKRKLVWVVTKMQVVIDRYPVWNDVIQVDTWVSASGRNSVRCDWIIRDSGTSEILVRASSVWVMMNKVTRRLSRIPKEVREEIEPHFLNYDPVVEDDGRKLTKLDEKTADFVRSGLTPRWSDLDINQHVNNVKYLGWILESAPLSILESYEIASLTLEYWRECGKNSVLRSLTWVSDADLGHLGIKGGIECQHLLQLETGAEIVKARTRWRPRHTNNLGTKGELPPENS